MRRSGQAQAQAAAAPTALAQLPPLTAGFTGRDAEMKALAGVLDPAGVVGSAAVAAVVGPPGVGKTTLAVEAGHAALQRGWFAGGTLFIDLHGYGEAPVQPLQALDALLRALGVPAEHIWSSADERAKQYRSALAKIGKPVLVIADNASSVAQVEPLLPGVGDHKVLVTSQLTLAALDARLVKVMVMDEPAAVNLLNGVLHTADPRDDRISGDREAASRLARVCGGLPLALQIVARLLKASPRLSSSELADELAVESERLERLQLNDGSGAATLSVAAVFSLTYNWLDESAARMFRFLPLNPGPALSTAAAAVLTDLPRNQASQVLGDLERAHLIEADPDAQDLWRMHDLLRLYAQQLSDDHAEPDGREQARDRLLSYYLHYTRAADAHLRAEPGQPVPGDFADLNEALTWLDAQRPSLVAAVSMAADSRRDRIGLELFLELAQYLDERRRFDEKLGIAAVGLDAARRLGDLRGEGQSLTILGGAWPQAGRFDQAVTACRRAVEIFHATGDQNFEAQALANLANVLAQGNHPEAAITEYRAAVAIFQQLGDRRARAVTLVDLGNALATAAQAGEAIVAYNEARDIFQILGERDKNAWALECLAGLLLREGRFEEAIVVSRTAAQIYQETGNRYGQGLALKTLGMAEWRVHRVVLAVTIWEESVACFGETGDRQEEASVLIELGRRLPSVLRAPEAIPALQRAASIYRESGDQDGEDLALASLRRVQKSARWQRWLPQQVVHSRLLTGPRVSWSTATNGVSVTDTAATRRWERRPRSRPSGTGS